jgi:predicted component of type VI protein secretion system
VTSQQQADLLLAHWQLLWPLPAKERIAMIEEIKRDYEFETVQQSVAEAMAEPEFV